jgi:Ca2+-binding RTX toxin-like protein
MSLIATGQWEVDGDTDWFGAMLEAGKSYSIELIGENGYVYRLGEDGVPADFAQFISADTPGHFTADAAGMVYFSAMGLTAGNYTIRLTEVADDFADSAASTGAFRNGAASGRFEAQADSDWFSARLTAGQAYEYGATSARGYQLWIADADGNLLDLPPVEGTAKGVFVPDTTGTYEFVMISTDQGSAFRAGNYTLSLKAIDHVDDYGHTPPTAGTITLGSGALPSGTATGKWELAGDKDWFAVELEANHTYAFTASGAAIRGDAGLISMVDAAGNIVAIPNLLGAGSANGGSFTAAADGTYYVQMQSSVGGGAYSVKVAEVRDDFTNSTVRPGTIAVNGTAAGKFEANNDVDWFRVNLTAGTSYSTAAVMKGRSDFTPIAMFLGEDGSVIDLAAFDQTFTAATTGTYYVQVMGITDKPAPSGIDYTLSVNSYRDDYADHDGTTGRITVGGQVTARTEVMFDEDWFAITLEAGKSYLFATTGGFIPPTIQVLLADGTLTGSTGAFTAHASGTHYISVTGFFPQGYTLTAQEYPDDYGDTPPMAGEFLNAPDFVFDGAQRIGTARADTLQGTAKGDLLRGLDGADRLSGGAGNDYLDGGTGVDRMIGGTGNDAYVVDHKNDKVTESANQGRDIVFSAISYTLGNHVEDLTLTGTGATSGRGNTLANEIRGNLAANILDGRDGADVLIGGGGRDTLTGGAGADTFRFGEGDTGRTGAAADRITDFSRAQGDRIDLSAIDARAGTAADDAFRFVGTGAFTGVAGQLRYGTASGFTFVSADTDGDKVADLVIKLDGTLALVAADFVL